jgi:hypothetical protein
MIFIRYAYSAFLFLIISVYAIFSGFLFAEAHAQSPNAQICYTAKETCAVSVKFFGALCWCEGAYFGGPEIFTKMMEEAGRGGPSDIAKFGPLLTTVARFNLLRFSFEYFQKSIDENKVSKTLNEIGVKVTTKDPINTLPSNTVIISTDVPPELGRFIALALLYNGVPVKAIVYYGINDPSLKDLVLAQGALPPRIRLIQIGTGVVDSARQLNENEILFEPLPLVRKQDTSDK